MARSTTSTRVSVVAATVVLLATSSAHAYGGFTKPKGEVYAKLAYVRSTSNQFYGLSGTLNDNGENLTQQAVTLYGEVGIWRGLQLALNVPVVRANAYENTDTATGFGDVMLEAKYGLSFGSLHLGLSVGPELPTGRDEAEVETDSGLAVVLPTGDGELNVWSRLGVSYGLYASSVPWLNSWVSAGVGYNIRTQGYHDQVGWGAELGTIGWNLVMLQGRVRGQIVPSDEIAFAGFIHGEGTEYVTLGAGLAMLIPHTPIGITLDWDRPIAAQKNLYGGNVWSAGMSTTFDLIADR